MIKGQWANQWTESYTRPQCGDHFTRPQWLLECR
jgi:hypothetical protein